MKSGIIRTEFDSIYDALNECYLAEDKTKSSTRAIRYADETFNSTQVYSIDIKMDMPDAAKQLYIDRLNKYIIDSGRLRDYFTTPLSYQVHHINLYSLGGENKLENFIILTIKEHQDIHKFLAEVLEPYKDEYYDTYSKCNKAVKAVTKSEIDFDDFIDIFYTTAVDQSIEMAKRNCSADISFAQSNVGTGIYSIEFTNGEKIKDIKGYQGIVDTCNARTNFPSVSKAKVKAWLRGEGLSLLVNKYGIKEITRVTDKQDRLSERPVILYPIKITDKIEIDNSKDAQLKDNLSQAADFLGKYTTDLSACANKNKFWQQHGKQPFHWLKGKDGNRYIIIDR